MSLFYWPEEKIPTTLKTCNTLLPAFVVSRLHALAHSQEWNDDEYPLTFQKVQGHLTAPEPYLSPVNFWIGGADNCHRELHIGGSLCWINPTDTDLFFTPISPDFFAQQPDDPNVWWCINHEEYPVKVTRIEIVKKALYGFPDSI